MKEAKALDMQSFLCPHGRYYGQFIPADLVFNANLQEFSQRVGFIASLQTSGKFSTEEAYSQIESLWNQLTSSKKVSKIDTDNAI